MDAESLLMARFVPSAPLHSLPSAPGGCTRAVSQYREGNDSEFYPERLTVGRRLSRLSSYSQRGNGGYGNDIRPRQSAPLIPTTTPTPAFTATSISLDRLRPRLPRQGPGYSRCLAKKMRRGRTSTKHWSWALTETWPSGRLLSLDSSLP